MGQAWGVRIRALAAAPIILIDRSVPIAGGLRELFAQWAKSMMPRQPLTPLRLRAAALAASLLAVSNARLYVYI